MMSVADSAGTVWRMAQAHSGRVQGPRPQYSGTYYGAFVLDPDGNNIEG